MALLRSCAWPTHPPDHAPAQIKRTEGVSTTDIVGRMLMCSRPSVREHAEKVGGGHFVTRGMPARSRAKPAWRMLKTQARPTRNLFNRVGPPAD